jgi:phosphonate transport system ATP-binding protein
MEASTSAEPGAAPPQGEAALVLDGLCKSYERGKPVLVDISLSFPKRGVVAIIGPSGTGKSTLIRCINRLVEPSAGRVLFAGRDITRLRGKGLRHARRRIGMVFQEYNLVERLSVMENLLCGRLGYLPAWRAWLRRFDAVDIEEAFELLDRVGLADFANQRADALSGGSGRGSVSREPSCSTRNSCLPMNPLRHSIPRRLPKSWG